jgi:hypothetical protein
MSEASTPPSGIPSTAQQYALHWLKETLSLVFSSWTRDTILVGCAIAITLIYRIAVRKHKPIDKDDVVTTLVVYGCLLAGYACLCAIRASYRIHAATVGNLQQKEEATRLQLRQSEQSWLESQRELADFRSKLVEATAPKYTVTSADWQQLAEAFKKTTSDFTAQCTTWSNPEKEHWMLNGGNMAECKALCQKAGAMLLKSHSTATTLPGEITQEQDPTSRWLLFMKHVIGLENTLHAVETLDNGGKNLIANGYIRSVAKSSASLCITLSAAEIERQR